MTELPNDFPAARGTIARFDTRMKALPWLEENKGLRSPHWDVLARIREYEDSGLDLHHYDRTRFIPTHMQSFHIVFRISGEFDWFYYTAARAATRNFWRTLSSPLWNPGIVGYFAAHAATLNADGAEHPLITLLRDAKYQQPDPNASPKPTWDEMLYAYDSWVIDRQARKQEAFNEAAVEAREKADALRLASVDGTDLHAGAGIDHMTGLVHMVERSNAAGVEHPLVVMRDEAGNAKKIWHNAKVRELLSDAMKRRNAEASARNVVNAELAVKKKIRDSRTATVADKIVAFNKANAILAAYDTKVEAAKTALASESYFDLPLDELRSKLVELIEAAAMRRVKKIKGAKTQQGVDVPATCLDMANALEQVAQECALGVQEIEGAADTAAAKTAFGAATATIEAVTPLNVPAFSVGGTTIADLTGTVVSGRTVTVRVDHPSGVTIPGNVAVTIPKIYAVDADGNEMMGIGVRISALQGQSAQDVAFTLPVAITGAVRLTLSARNLCGPSVLTLTLTPR